jgi:hypothetical protein
MRTKEDVERYLDQMEITYRVLGDGIYRLDDDAPEVEDIVVMVTGPLVIFSVPFMKLPKANRTAFYAKLLELNATAMIAGAYGIDGDRVVITDTLQLENLDFNEFEASVTELAMAIHNHYPILKTLAEDCAQSDDAKNAD